MRLGGIEKREPAALSFFDDADVDPGQEREALSLKRRRDVLCRRRNRSGGHVPQLAKARIGQQLDARAALVLPQHERSRPDRMGPDIVAVGLDHLPRKSGGIGNREHIEKTQIRRLQPDLQRIAIDDGEPCHRGVVVELAGFERPRAHFVGADDLAFEHPQPRRLDRRIQDALECVRVVARRQFPRFAPEGRVGREQDPFLHPHRERPAALLHHRHRLERARDELHGARQVVVVKHGLHHVGDDLVGGGIRSERRVEARFGDLQRHMQRLAGVRGVRLNLRRQGSQRRDQHSDPQYAGGTRQWH
jgi:hypothetical protein